MISINIKQTEEIIAQKILQAVANKVNLTLKSCTKEIEVQTKILLEDAIKGQKEYNDIINSELRYELGLLSAFSRLEIIIKTLVDSVRVTHIPLSASGSRLSGGLKVEAVHSGYGDILGLKEASFLTEKGVELNWLEWLLLRGTNVIIGDYSFLREDGRGRTHGGIMIKGGGWSVPSESAGTIGDNFITRAIQEIQEPLIKIIKKCLI